MQPEVLEAIRLGVRAGMARLPDRLRAWADAHLVEPRMIRAAVDSDGKDWSEFVLVTDDTGQDDGSYRVVYDPTSHTFGTVTEIQNGSLWYLGPDDSFDSAVVHM